MRVIFLGSPESVLAPLEFLLTKMQGVELIAVVSQPPRPVGRSKELIDPAVAQFAKQRGLRVFQPEKASDPLFLEALRQLKPDLMITAAYGQILNDDFLRIPKRGTINIHPSLLPKYRGATPVPAALLAGDQETGVTILFTVKKLDAGNIIAQERSAIQSQERTDQLTVRLFQLSTTLLPNVITMLENPDFIGEPQQDKDVTVCKKITKDDGAINWEASATEILNRFRAFYPWPGAYTFLSGKRVAIEAMATAELTSPKLSPGSLQFSKGDKAILVGTGSGNLMISQLKPAGGRIQDASSFWHGLKSKDAIRFGDAQ
jgi:methionyl-tRNA formyltransferase